jgi:hypothetical protein
MIDWMSINWIVTRLSGSTTLQSTGGSSYRSLNLRMDELRVVTEGLISAVGSRRSSSAYRPITAVLYRRSVSHLKM